MKRNAQDVVGYPASFRVTYYLNGQVNVIRQPWNTNTCPSFRHIRSRSSPLVQIRRHICLRIMARISQTAKRSVKPLTSWTRFHLPRNQEWPTWSVDHDDVHVGPLEGVEGWRTASLGIMIDNPEQAAYIIREFNLHRKCIASSLADLIVILRRMG